MKKLILLLMILFSSKVFSVDIKNTYPLRGQGEYNFLFLSVYDAKLWGPPSSDLYTAPLGLELKYKRTFKGEEIAKQTEKELAHAGVSNEIITKWRGDLLKIFPNVKEGDTIFASYKPNEGLTFYFNSSKELGRISDLDFSKHFLNIWLGEKTRAPELRDRLLGRKI